MQRCCKMKIKEIQRFSRTDGLVFSRILCHINGINLCAQMQLRKEGQKLIRIYEDYTQAFDGLRNE